MNYAQTIDYLFSCLPMFSRIGAAAYKKDLTNTLKLCEALGNPHQKLKYVHVAGTNGKGSISHMLAAVFQTAGYKTGLYTSPHLKDFRERIKVNGLMCGEDYVVEFVEQYRDLIESIKPSFFEITVAMALDYFVQQQVDIAVIEVGLGGRLDSTNVITPELSVITNIGFDHMDMLGTTLDAIAFEKAGIIKQGIPAVVGESQPLTRPVFLKKAGEMNAPIYFAEEELFVNNFSFPNHILEAEVVSHYNQQAEHYQLDLTGIYQLKNLLTVLSSCYHLNKIGWNLQTHHIKEALRQVKKLTALSGRWQVIHHSPEIVLDVAHNVDGIKQLLSQLEHCNYQHLHIVTGMVKDKDISAVLGLLPKHARYYFTNAAIPRALPAESLQAQAKAHDLTGQHYPDVNTALMAAKEKATHNDLILVCGSVFTVGEVVY